MHDAKKLAQVSFSDTRAVPHFLTEALHALCSHRDIDNPLPKVLGKRVGHHLFAPRLDLLITAATAMFLSFVRDFIQVSRPGWWIITFWLYLAPIGRRGGGGGGATADVDWRGLLLVTLPLNAAAYGTNDAADLCGDPSNARKGNFVFGPAGWSGRRLLRVLVPAWTVTFASVLCFGFASSQLPSYMLWFLQALVTNYLYNFHSFSWELLIVFAGYGSITLLSYWRHYGGGGLGLLVLTKDGDDKRSRWYFAGCNQEYWIHFTLLVLRSQLWLELLDYETDRRNGKRTTLSRLRSKQAARLVVLSVLMAEVLFCSWCYQQYGNDWSVLFGFACMGVVLFASLEYAVLPATRAKSTATGKKADGQQADLLWLATVQNAGAIYLLYDCCRRGVFVK
jgi:4-hydroxybenzoate polyprenyltransferase